MIYENVVSGVKTPINKLYEYVDGRKQEIQERYELVNGRKELVFKNKTIKRECFVDANGIALNGLSGGETIGEVMKYYYIDRYYSESTSLSSPQAVNKNITLGIASGKRITKIEVEFVNCEARYYRESTSTSTQDLDFRLLGNGSIIYTSRATSYEINSSIRNVYRKMAYLNKSVVIDLDRVLNNISMSFNIIGTLTDFTRGDRDTDGHFQLSMRNLYITYVE